ncbi:hypothetical protein GKD00_04965 [Lactobacillus ruminis]|uniref:hypothetical protein n=1 Tax=Ligilactobacillus ruminis TaxID=1623 RepID=UPI00101FC1A1|nr:hypothetical protein [Ligilactobacillus ruminis]MSB43583.1 hypothetical protein [Ligilactobacillus ruminis]MSB54580.1 hypothetical protein [Ligilactobacillus ruminis]MSB56271.1 hypothetical protein [Ligilactobacillus ruminis]MSB81319.1 hypothetical protein [Ligilactobacillus ruminis]MSB91115.1 hypothetical protein [Ligilactobacillus ruminis]
MKTTNIQYNFNEDGTTQSINVSMRFDVSPNYVSASIELSAADLTDGKTLDDLTRKQISDLAHAKLVKVVG